MQIYLALLTSKKGLCIKGIPYNMDVQKIIAGFNF